MSNTDTASLELQRCDFCDRFDADEEAQRWVASEESALVMVLFEFCSALKAEAERAVHEETNDHEDGKQALQTIRDSLRNVCLLRTMERDARSADAVHHFEGKDMRIVSTGDCTMKTTYVVGVREVHVRFYEVQADDPEQAKDLVNERAPEAVDLEFDEYSHELRPDTWSVEEKGEEKTP
jgi:hypothetical protein